MSLAPTRRIVIVDDDAAVLAMLTSALKSWRFEAVPFARFEDARAFLERRSLDVLIVDVRLGKYNGLQLVHLARQKDPQPLVIAVSGYDDPVLRAAAEDAGATFLMKPLALPQLRDHLTAA
jgi:DNA-binding response OmpR family regulator